MNTTISSYADCHVSPELACSRILSEEGFAAWWIGNVKIVERDTSWPAIGSKMIWQAGGGTFNAVIVEDNRPASVVIQVETPSADSRITNSFQVLPNGDTRYTKSFEPIGRSWISRFFLPLLILMLKSFVKKEVRRAAAFADAV